MSRVRGWFVVIILTRTWKNMQDIEIYSVLL